ncbi:MAG: hypothetical protein JWM53_88 [bacterium]|nr:hypothetical protein [bacterium]
MRALALAIGLLVAGCVGTTNAEPDAPASDGGADLAGCSTSCDCPAGQTCAGGTCIAGVIDVYCCSSESCPSGAVCQAPSGEVSVCGGASGLGNP